MLFILLDLIISNNFRIINTYNLKKVKGAFKNYNIWFEVIDLKKSWLFNEKIS